MLFRVFRPKNATFRVPRLKLHRALCRSASQVAGQNFTSSAAKSALSPFSMSGDGGSFL
jgi:hypothetical protein